MQNTLLDFEKRQQAMHRKHARLARGYTTKIDKNTGVITHVPEAQSAGFGLKLLLVILPGFLVFKAFVLAWLGGEAYQQHVQDLALGSEFEQAGAWLMQVDPITAKLAALIASVIG
ncbi:MAG: hypothetical protein OIF55_21400 [Amphritea sp.]|jgi:hypothetical protein|nr:hypothetical protein [Pelagimonas sp.]MCV6613315.1 hypothetical protein [Amphritea sp.]